MNYNFILGLGTFVAGLALVVFGTDYGRIINVTMGVIIGAILVLMGMARMKYAWINRKDGESKK
jgi:multisubunit Na+/H+ antiporter MnhG subunit